MGYLEAGAGVGSILGPVIGSILYAQIGYKGSFYAFGGLILVNLIFSLICIPNFINNTVNEDANNDKSESFIEQPSMRSPLLDGKHRLTPADLTYRNILSHKRPAFAYSALACALFCIQFSSAFLTIHLKKEFDIDEEDMGFVFSCVTIPYVIVALLMGCTISRLMPKRMVHVTGLTIATIAIGFMGTVPIFFFGAKPEYWHILTGLVIIGTAQPLLIVPVLPEALDNFKLYYDHVEGIDKTLDAQLAD